MTDDLTRRFTYHPPTPEQPEVYALVRDAGHHLALLVETVALDCRERALAVTKIEESVMWANAAIARGGLSDAAYSGAADVHDLVLTRLSEGKPDSSMLSKDPSRWHVDLDDGDEPQEAEPSTDPWLEKPAAHDVQCLRSGLEVIAQRGCSNYTRGDCWSEGRTADAEYAASRACTPCIAARVLAGERLPSTHDTGPGVPLIVQMVDGEPVVRNPEVIDGRGMLVLPESVDWRAVLDHAATDQPL